MSRELYNSVVSKVAMRVPMFAKAVVDKALERVGATPYTVTPSQMRIAIERHITPRLGAFLKPSERVVHLGSGFVSIDREGCLVGANQAARAMLGVGREAADDEVVGRAVALGVVLPLAELERLGEDALVREVRLDAGRTLNVALAQVHDGGGRAAGVVSVIQDVTLVQMLEEEMDQLFAELDANHASLERSQRKLQYYVAEIEQATRAKSRLLANVSHELRTPLNAIIGFTDTVLHGVDGPLLPAQQESLSWVAQSARYLLSLIDDLLDLSCIEAGKLELTCAAVEVAAVCAAAVSTVAGAAAEKGIEIVVEGCGEPSALRTDELRLRQILVNLVANAVKFTAHGTVTVRVADGGHDQLRIDVVDTGPGIPAHQLVRIWDEFHQVQASVVAENGARGAGLGLSISQRLAHALGGSLSVESETGRGSTFSLVLPRNPPDRSAVARNPGPPLSLELQNGPLPTSSP